MPARQKIAPNIKTSTETKAAMMPPKKTRAKRIMGDPAYGAGESSGRKAKRVKGKRCVACHALIQQYLNPSYRSNSPPKPLSATQPVPIPAPQTLHSLPHSSLYMKAPHAYPSPHYHGYGPYPPTPYYPPGPSQYPLTTLMMPGTTGYPHLNIHSQPSSSRST
jgi:hypothetical protein